MTDSTNVKDDLPNDSPLTLGQLKKIVKQLPSKQKQPQHDFGYADSDSLKNEIDELYNYLEMSQYLENEKIFQEGFDEPWTKCTLSERRVYVEYLLEQLELKDAEKRLATARRLVYIAQGSFAEFSDTATHLHWITENNKVLRKSGALLSYNQALRLACTAHDLTSQIDPMAPQLADINREIDCHLTLLYMLVEVHRGDEKFGDELSRLDPPLAVSLFGLVAQLREKNVKTFPVKKLLLLLWKVILSSFGSVKDFAMLKNAARNLNGLLPLTEEGLRTKSTPQDLYTFQTEITQKYPTYTPPSLPLSITNPAIIKPSTASSQAQQTRTESPNPTSANGGKPPSGPMTGSKRQQSIAYQNSNRSPFIFPFTMGGPAVPKSIQEAGELYLGNMYVGLASWQVFKEREAFLKSGAAWGRNPVQIEAEEDEWGDQKDDVKTYSEEEEVERRRLERVEVVYRAILPNVQNIIIVLLKLLLATVTTNVVNGATATTAKANGTNLSNGPVANGQPDPPNSENGTTVNGTPPLSSSSSTVTPSKEAMEEMDNLRNREINSKAISAILLLMLKYSKVAHVLKFEYLCQLLVDSGCLLLILKMLGLQDITATVCAQSELEGCGFFQYCAGHSEQTITGGTNESVPLTQVTQNVATSTPTNAPSSASATIDNEQLPQSPTVLKTCWRNMFWSINFLRILQKLTKKKTHRIMLLVQYKSSAILKRILKVSHPMLELYTLKVLKSQVPYLGRKWRSSNMKIITSIYMHCRPDLRDEWVSGGDVDAELEDALSQEHNLRSLIKFYNERHYPDIFGNSNDSDNQSPQIDDDGVPTDFPSVHVIPDEIALDDTFIHNYERWLDSEVYSVPASPSSPTSSRTFFDDGYDSTDDIDIPLPGSDNWDNPTVYSHEMESSRDALFCNINWDSGGDVLAQQILAEQYNKNGWPVEIDVNDEDSLKILDSMAGCWIDAEDTHDGVRPGDPNWDQQAGQ